MGLTHITTCNQSSGGGGGGGSNVTGFTYDIATETATITTDQPNVFNANIPSTAVLTNKTIYVDPVYGNNATAIPDSLTKKYQTLDAALSAFSNDYTYYLFPGNHFVNNQFTVNETLKIYMAPGAILNANYLGNNFVIAQGRRLEITGYGTINISTSLFSHVNPSSAIPAEVIIECNTIDSNGSGVIGDFSSIIFDIKTYYSNDRGIVADGWCKGSMSCDYWVSSGSAMVRLEDFNTYSGPNKYAEYGAQKVIIQGRTKPRCFFKNQLPVSQGIYTKSGDFDPCVTQVELNVDFDSTDGFFVDPGRGTITHNGHLVHRKSDTVGNEVPWIFATQQPSSDRYAPIFIHNDGSYVSGTHPLFDGSQNNEIINIQMLGTFIFNGKYQNSGVNTGLGAWPIIEFSNPSPINGQTKIILNGQLKNISKESALINIDLTINPLHTLRLEVDKATTEHPVDSDWIKVNANMLIYVQHSLSMNGNYSSSISDGISVGRTIVDTNVQVFVPEYGQ